MSEVMAAAALLRAAGIPAFCRASQQTNSKADERSDFLHAADELLACCGVPELYRQWRLNDFAAVPNTSWLRGGVLVKGPTGTGKSCYAAALLRSRLRPDHPRTLATETPHGRSRYEIAPFAARWFRCGAVLFAARGAFRDGGTSESELIAECVRPRLVILDDLCSGKMTDNGWTIIAEIIAQRVDSMRDTIVTTNLTLAEIHEHEPRLASRLAAFEEVVMGGPDKRLGELVTGRGEEKNDRNT